MSNESTNEIVDLREIDLGDFKDRFSIRKLLATGSFASVYKAFDKQRRCDVALKIATDVRDRSIFDRECQTLAQLDTHPNIIRMFLSGTCRDGKPFLVLDYIRDGSLQKYIEDNGVVSWDHAVKLLAPICDAVSFAHGKGIVHGDIKPSNILYSSIGLLVADFGAAKEKVGGKFDLWQVKSPEAETTDLLDERGDLYALAATLHVMIFGEPPQKAAERTKLSTSNTIDIPSWLTDVLETSLSQNPDDRYDSVLSLLAHLEEGLATTPSQETTAPSEISATRQEQTTLVQSRRFTKRRSLLALLGIVALVALASFGYIYNKGNEANENDRASALVAEPLSPTTSSAVSKDTLAETPSVTSGTALPENIEVTDETQVGDSEVTVATTLSITSPAQSQSSSASTKIAETNPTPKPETSPKIASTTAGKKLDPSPAGPTSGDIKRCGGSSGSKIFKLWGNDGGIHGDGISTVGCSTFTLNNAAGERDQNYYLTFETCYFEGATLLVSNGQKSFTVTPGDDGRCFYEETTFTATQTALESVTITISGTPNYSDYYYQVSSHNAS